MAHDLQPSISRPVLGRFGRMDMRWMHLEEPDTTVLLAAVAAMVFLLQEVLVNPPPFFRR